MRILLAVIAGLGLTVAALAGPVFVDPRGPVTHIYALYESGDFSQDPTELFTPALRDLWEASFDEDPVGLGFDPFIDGQDFEITDLVISDPVIDGDSATVAASFRNFGHYVELHYELLRRAEGWKIDDLISVGEPGWRLGELLAVDPMLN